MNVLFKTRVLLIYVSCDCQKGNHCLFWDIVLFYVPRFVTFRCFSITAFACHKNVLLLLYILSLFMHLYLCIRVQLTHNTYTSNNFLLSIWGNCHKLVFEQLLFTGSLLQNGYYGNKSLLGYFLMLFTWGVIDFF